MKTENIDELKKEIKRLEETFAEELKRKDKIIDDLREENTLMFKASMKSSEKIEDLTKKLQEKMKKINE